ncbi:hypothetical protein HKX48_006738 [Thoreauomyces humboldtii]|nr:hypothetical protein HKX48_006738 [Thoreauomyces humboldtii]
MNQYRQVFGITRVPKPGCDINVGSHPCTSGHIVVFVRDQIYRVDVNDSNTGERVGISEIEKQLQAVVKDVKRGENIQAPIGLLTAIHRDKWAELHEHLEKLSPSNRENFHEIETALFAVSLDDYTLPTNIEYLARNTAHAMNGRNRWFDKSISVCIMADGRTGINGEHSPCDALIPAMMADEVVKNEPARDPPHLKQHPTLQPPRKLLWKVDPKVINGLEEAQKVVTKDIANSDVKILQYSSYGSTFMKKIGKASPDAYMQMALQLTFFRVHGKFAPVYETASTRQYKHGRTETCRSLSLECKEFVEAFSNPSASNTDRYARFQKACAAHVKYLTIAGQGRGVDRHLLGLRMLGQPGEPVPAIFSDPAYAKSSHWQLSTSGLFPGDRILATGFGSVVEDGYGMNYMIAPDLIKIGVESKIACKDTSSARFTETLQRVLDDIAQMCRDINGDNAKPKL